MEIKKIPKILIYLFFSVIIVSIFIGVSSAAYMWDFNSKYRFFNCTDDDYCIYLNYNSMQSDKNYLSLSLDSQIFDYLWVANTYENTVSKIDTRTNKEMGRYYTYNGYSAPSRTAVDKEGNVWVGNRDGSKEVIKIIGVHNFVDCADKNGNGIIDSSNDSNNNGIIEIGEILPWGQDECVVKNINYWPTSSGYGGARALTIDSNGYLWVGIWDLGQYYKFDSNGNLISTLYSGGNSYGMCAGENSIVWSNEPYLGLVKINTTDNSYIRYSTSLFGCSSGNHCFYVIGADKEGNVWLNNWANGNLNKFNYTTYELCKSQLDKASCDSISNCNYDISTNACNGGVTAYNNFGLGGTSLRGLTVGKDRYIWLTTYYHGIVFKVNPDTGGEVCRISGLGVLSGIAEDGDGNIWAIGTDWNARVYKINHSDCSLITSVPVGSGPYTYSDTTGNLVMQFVKGGFWDVIIGSEGGTINWTNISWNESNIQPEDSISVNLSFLDAGNIEISKIGFLHDTPHDDSKNYSFDLGNIHASKLHLRVTMHKNNPASSPNLSNLFIGTEQVNKGLKCSDIAYENCTQASTTNNPDAMSYFPDECIKNPDCYSCYCEWEGDETTGICKPARESINGGTPQCGGVSDCLTNPEMPECSIINCETNPELPECKNCKVQCIVNDYKINDNCNTSGVLTMKFERNLAVNDPTCAISEIDEANCGPYEITYDCSVLDFFDIKNFIMAILIVFIIYFVMLKYL